MMVKEIILSIAIGSVTGCATHYEHVQYPCPPHPALPIVSATELQTLSDEVYAKLVHREEVLKSYMRLLEVNCARR